MFTYLAKRERYSQNCTRKIRKMEDIDCIQKRQLRAKVLEKGWGFQKLLKAEANRRVRMCNLQSAKDCASVKTSLATVRARAQEWGNQLQGRDFGYKGTGECARTRSFRAGEIVRDSAPWASLNSRDGGTARGMSSCLCLLVFSKRQGDGPNNKFNKPKMKSIK